MVFYLGTTAPRVKTNFPGLFWSLVSPWLCSSHEVLKSFLSTLRNVKEMVWAFCFLLVPPKSSWKPSHLSWKPEDHRTERNLHHGAILVLKHLHPELLYVGTKWTLSSLNYYLFRFSVPFSVNQVNTHALCLVEPDSGRVHLAFLCSDPGIREWCPESAVPSLPQPPRERGEHRLSFQKYFLAFIFRHLLVNKDR